MLSRDKCMHATYCFVLADAFVVSSVSLELCLLIRCGSHALVAIGALTNGSLIDIYNFFQRISFGLFTVPHGKHKTLSLPPNRKNSAISVSSKTPCRIRHKTNFS